MLKLRHATTPPRQWAAFTLLEQYASVSVEQSKKGLPMWYWWLLLLPFAIMALAVYSYKQTTILGYYIIDLLDDVDDFVQGRDLYQELEKNSVRVSAVTFYYACNELEKARCITSVDETDEIGKRRCFKIRPGAQLRWKFKRIF